MRMLRTATLLTLVMAALLATAPAAAAQATPGDLLWSFPGGTDSDDAGRAVVARPSGDFVTGCYVGGSIVCSSLTAAGDVGFTTSHAAPGDPADRYETLAALVLAGGGGVSVAGAAHRDGMPINDYLLVQFTAAGALGAVNTYGAVDLGEAATAVAVDGAGARYVTGDAWTRTARGALDIVTIKYDAAGARVWARRFDGPDHKYDHAAAVAVRGRWVYVTGTCERRGHSKDVVLIKYDAASGARLWTRYYDDARHGNDAPTDLVVTSNAVYVGGTGRQKTGVPPDALLLKYRFDGSRAWVRYTKSAGRDVWSDLEWSSGALRATGSLFRSATGRDVMTAAWRPDGTVAWRTTFTTVVAHDEAGVALATDAAGGCYVACSCANGTDTDIRVLAYGPDGDTLWYSIPYASLPGLDDVPADIAVSDAAVAVVGSTTITADDRDYVILGYEK